MPETNIETAHKKREELDAIDTPNLHLLPFELLESQSTKTTQLAATRSDITPIAGKHRWHKYKFTEDVFLCKIIVETDGYTPKDKFEFSWITEQDKSVTIEFQHNGKNSFTAPANRHH